MRSIEWLCCQLPWVIPNHLKPPQFLHFFISLCIFVIGDHKDSKFDVQVERASHSLRMANHPWQGMFRSCDPLKNFTGSNHITGMAQPKVVKFCTLVGYINSSNSMTYHPQKGHGYGHVTVLKFCCLPRCSMLRGFVSDSWATCYFKKSLSCFEP